MIMEIVMESETKYVKMKRTAALLRDENPDMIREHTDTTCRSVAAA